MKFKLWTGLYTSVILEDKICWNYDSFFASITLTFMSSFIDVTIILLPTIYICINISPENTILVRHCLRCCSFCGRSLCVSDISFRCNQATVAFFKSLCLHPPLLMMEVVCWGAKFFIALLFLLHVNLVWEGEKLERLVRIEDPTIVEKDEAKITASGDRGITNL